MHFAFATNTEITYNRHVLSGISQYARYCGDLQISLLAITHPQQFKDIDEAGYDGILMSTLADDSKEANRLRTPVVNVSHTHVGLRFPLVCTDDFEVGRIVGQHLVTNGYRHFAFSGRTLGWAEERWRGFTSSIVEALGKAHAPARSTAPNKQEVAKWLAALPRPIGVMGSNDPTAKDLIEICRKKKWRIPEEVAVVGADDDELHVEITDPPLTSVGQQTQRIGYLAAESLRRLVNGEKIPKITLVPPGPLVIRKSSDAVAMADAVVNEAVRYMRENLAKNINIAELADAIGTSRRVLENRFTQTLGRPPGKELLRLKIDRVKSLLSTSSQPMKQIARLAGFGNSIRLCQAFRDQTGQSPTEYRKKFTQHHEGLTHS